MLVQVRQGIMVNHQKRLQNSGVGTIAAIATLATTHFRPQSNIHNLL